LKITTFLPVCQADERAQKISETMPLAGFLPVIARKPADEAILLFHTRLP